MKLSAVVPSCRPGVGLDRCLASLQHQDAPDYEILLVDNTSEGRLRAAINYVNRSSKRVVRYVHEPCLGLQHARHAGVRASQGEVIAFIDDDATATPGWLTAYQETFARNPRMPSAGGPVRPVWESEPPRWLERYLRDRKFFGPLALIDLTDELRIDPEMMFFGVNMAHRRTLFFETGFRPELVGARTIGNGESGLQAELAQRGTPIGYVPEAVVHHHIPPRRATVAHIRRWAWHHGAAEMYGRWWGQARSLDALARELVGICRAHGGSWALTPWLRRRRDPRAIDLQFRASVGLCRLAYVWWMLTDPTVRSALDQRDFRPLDAPPRSERSSHERVHHCGNGLFARREPRARPSDRTRGGRGGGECGSAADLDSG